MLCGSLRAYYAVMLGSVDCDQVGSFVYVMRMFMYLFACLFSGGRPIRTSNQIPMSSENARRRPNRDASNGIRDLLQKR